jgi:micrococcal nuclease
LGTDGKFPQSRWHVRSYHSRFRYRRDVHPWLIAIACIATDGDTLRCGSERYRLLGIDAPELAGHCRKGRVCAPGDPIASKASLARMIDGKQVHIEIVGKDRYGRGLVLASVNGADLSCSQIRSSNAQYVARWDTGKRIARICRL